MVEFLQYFPQYYARFRTFYLEYSEYVRLVFDHYVTYYVKSRRGRRGGGGGRPLDDGGSNGESTAAAAAVIPRSLLGVVQNMHHQVYCPNKEFNVKFRITHSIVENYFDGMDVALMLSRMHSPR